MTEKDELVGEEPSVRTQCVCDVGNGECWWFGQRPPSQETSPVTFDLYMTPHTHTQVLLYFM